MLRASSSARDQNLQPIDQWHAQQPTFAPAVSRGAGLRAQQQLLAHRRTPHNKGVSVAYHQAVRATAWSLVATALFGLGIVLPLKGRSACLDFFTGFLVEKSLSVDNLFVFLMIFKYFKVPEAYTQRVLSWGILSALVLRAFMIGLGVAVVRRFKPVLLIFALVLVVSAVKMLMPEDDAELSENVVMKLARRLVDATDTYDQERFFTTVGGTRKATPLLVVLLCIEISDVIFAVDSIPAVVGITQDAFVVYSSNVFALLALRSLYLVLSKSVQSMHYLKHAVALILLFVGLKMTLEFVHVDISSTFSLGVILLQLASGVGASLARKELMTVGQRQGRAHATV